MQVRAQTQSLTNNLQTIASKKHWEVELTQNLHQRKHIRSIAAMRKHEGMPSCWITGTATNLKQPVLEYGLVKWDPSQGHLKSTVETMWWRSAHRILHHFSPELQWFHLSCLVPSRKPALQMNVQQGLQYKVMNRLADTDKPFCRIN